MNEYLTSNYKDYPVLFKNLKASSSAAGFGIFCAVFFAGFVFRGLEFMNLYMEQKKFHNYVYGKGKFISCEGENDPSIKLICPGSRRNSSGHNSELGIKEKISLNMHKVARYAIPLILELLIAMFSYALMLASMSFVLIYFMAVCLGLAFSQVFFNRLGIVLDVRFSLDICKCA